MGWGAPWCTMRLFALVLLLHGAAAVVRNSAESVDSVYLSAATSADGWEEATLVEEQQVSKAKSKTSECTRSWGVVRISGKTPSGADKYTFSAAKCNKPATDGAVARALFDDRISTTGWSELTIRTAASGHIDGAPTQFTDLQQAFAAGFAEGALTHERMYQIYLVCTTNHAQDTVYEFFMKQDAYLRSMIARTNTQGATPAEQYWYNVALVLAQFDGVLAGYNSMAPNDRKMQAKHLWLINSDGDVLDVERAVTPGRRVKTTTTMNKAELIELVSLHGHCSALVKLTADDLLSSHTTWDDYNEMIRTYKHYEFDFRHPAIVSRKASFSSYPGFIFSSDDFYVLDTGLVVLETTLNILNDDLYSFCDPEKSVLAWVRNLIANRVAKTAEEWVRIFALYNSGTYNDQWIVIDYNKYTKGQRQLTPGTVWVVEQIPGTVESEDVTAIVQERGYWASYNRPYFKKINELSMYRHYSNMHGEMFSYMDCPRARIFNRDQSKVRDVEGMKALMMQNNWQNDPFSLGCPGNAIAARFDIYAPNCSMRRVPNGGTDCKITSSEWVRDRKAMAYSGPTHFGQPAFSWNDPAWANTKHEGQPTVWNFEWVAMVPPSSFEL